MVILILEMMFGDVFEWNQSDIKLWNKRKIIFLMIKKVITTHYQISSMPVLLTFVDFVSIVFWFVLWTVFSRENSINNPFLRNTLVLFTLVDLDPLYPFQLRVWPPYFLFLFLMDYVFIQMM